MYVDDGKTQLVDRKTQPAYLLRMANKDLESHKRAWDQRSREYDKEIKQLKEEKQKLLDQISHVANKTRMRQQEMFVARKAAEGAIKLAEENATLRKHAEDNDEAHRRSEEVLRTLRDVLSDARKEKDAAVLENQNLKRKRAGSTNPPPPQIKLLVRPQQAASDQQAVPSPARTEPPSSAQPSNKRSSRNRKDRWANAPTTSANVGGFDKALDPVLHFALTSFQTKADIISQINASSDHLRLGRNNELVFHRTTVEDQAKVIRKAQA
jgi:hypothetical protein